MTRIPADDVDSGNPRVRLLPMPDGGVAVAWMQWRLTPDVGDDVAVARLGPDGTVVATYGAGGRHVQRLPESSQPSLATTPSGHVLVAWSALRHPDDPFDGSATHHLLRLTPTGGPDASFGDGGVATIGSVPTGSDGVLAVGADGERPLLLTWAVPGLEPEQRLTRLTTTGAVDTSFFGDGTAIVGHDPTAGGIDHVLLGGSGRPITIVKRSYDGNQGTPDTLELRRLPT